MRETEIQIDGNIVTGVEVDLPTAPLVLASGANGFVMDLIVSIKSGRIVPLCCGVQYDACSYTKKENMAHGD